MRVLTFVVFVVAIGSASAQDRVKCRERGTKGGDLTATGKIEGESIAGLKVGNKLIASGDILEVHYDVPGELKLDYNRALGEETKNPANAAKEFEALVRHPRVKDSKSLRRHFEYRITMIAAARADDSAEAMQKAIDALTKFRKDHPDSWQFVPATRLLGRLLTAKEPPDSVAARKVYEELAAAKDAPPDVRQECTFLVIDLMLQAGQADEAQAKLKALPPSDPRVKVYEIGARSGDAATVAKGLEEFIDATNDPALKAAAYNMLGDVLRRDPKTKKEALYAYLKVELLYNQDPAETLKAVQRIADLFAELKDEDRAKKYRDKARGRSG
jgi:hypothetical protein